jgi:large subunit ribosomal protein L5
LDRLQEKYQKEVVPALTEKFGYKNVMQLPKVEKVIINMGVGEAVGNPKALEAAVSDLTIISGQKPIVTRAKKSIATWKIREGMAIGAKVTLRGSRMYQFLDKFMNVALPRVRDFHGVSPKAFDGRGNYSLGIQEQLIFPEIEYDKIDRTRGMDITFVTNCGDDVQARALFDKLGFPFKAK